MDKEITRNHIDFSEKSPILRTDFDNFDATLGEIHLKFGVNENSITTLVSSTTHGNHMNEKVFDTFFSIYKALFINGFDFSVELNGLLDSYPEFYAVFDDEDPFDGIEDDEFAANDIPFAWEEDEDDDNGNIDYEGEDDEY